MFIFLPWTLNLFKICFQWASYNSKVTYYLQNLWFKIYFLGEHCCPVGILHPVSEYKFKFWICCSWPRVLLMHLGGSDDTTAWAFVTNVGTPAWPSGFGFALAQFQLFMAFGRVNYCVEKLLSLSLSFCVCACLKSRRKKLNI